MAVDKVKFADELRHIGSWQGGRVADANISKTPDVVAGAIAMSILKELHGMSGHKRLSPADIKEVIVAFHAASGLEEYEGNMGGTMYRRKGVAK